MRRLLTAGFALAVAGTTALGSAEAQTVAGGLTALPTVELGPNLIQNGGFETLSGGLPVNWTTGTGWGVDQLVQHGGSFSYRRTTGAGTSSQMAQVKKGVYKFSAWIKTENLGAANAGVRLQLDLRPALNQWFTTEVISGTRDWTLYEVKNIVVPQDMTVTLKLENFAGPAGTAWFDDAKLEEQLAQSIDVFLLYPNYRGMLFDDQPMTMRFDVTVTPPGGDFGRYKVVGTLKDEAGPVLLSRDYSATGHFVAELDGSLMAYGRPYLVTFTLVELSNGSVAGTYPAYRVSKASGAARQSMNVSFDAKNRVLIKGQPRFVLGAYDSGGGYSAADSYWENQLWSPTGPRRMEGLRINMYLNYWMGEADAASMKALMANLQRRGIMYLQTGNCFDKFPAGPNFLINSSDAYVLDIGAHSGSAGYYTIDECRSELAPGAFTQYQRLRSLDPDSMTFAALFGNPDIVFWRDAADVLSSDPYPMFGSEPAGGYNHKQVADWTAQTREAVKNARPILTVLQFFKFTSLGRWPTRAEMRNHAYMAIVEGAKGLWWWSLGNGAGALASATTCSPAGSWCPEQVAHFDDLKAVVGELADLEPVLLADDAVGTLTGNSNPTAIRTKVKVLNGKGYLFAYNYTNASAAVTFTWNTGPSAVQVHAENRSVTPTGASFSDTFGPYQAHVYIVETGTAAAPQLTVSAATAAPGSTVTATLSNGPGGPTDWLALAPVGAPDTTYLTWTYVGSGMSTRAWTVTMPSAPGTYEFRFFLNNGFVRTATSPPVTVAAAGPTLAVSAGTAAPGATITATLTGGPGGPTDWLALAPAGSPDTTYLNWIYVGSGVSTRTWTVTMPSAPGTYEFRFFLNNGFVRTATSPPVTVK